MITRTEPACQSNQPANQPETIKLYKNKRWQQALAGVIRDPRELFALLELDPVALPATFDAIEDFPLRVPHGFVRRMKKGDWHDPLLRQVLPLKVERQSRPGFSYDPLAEAQSNPHAGLIHKYQGRVLLIVSTGCAINCRYCFRRHFPYAQNNPGQAQWQQALRYIRDDSSIKEVILSGGDPLAASDKLLAHLVGAIADISHVTTVRVHSRMPVVIPERITSACLDWLTATHLQPVMVIHCNHANELDYSVKKAMTAMKAAGVTLLNQTVLLAGVNDNEKALSELSEKLFEYGALPYYLHLLDKVQGAAHFDVSRTRACQLHKALLAKLPGYLVPRLVQEQAGADSKVAVQLF